MVEVTVLIPTHDHADTLFYSVASVQAQTVTDFEIFIVGDGVPPRTREVVGELIDKDPRIRFFDNPKGPRHGEVHRHAALQEASGKFVCYQCDDDLWLPQHLAYLCAALSAADLAHNRWVSLTTNDRVWLDRCFKVNHPRDVRLMRENKFGFNLATAGHSLEAYRRLPFGWRTTPANMNTDVYMWLQFLDQPWCRAVGSKRITLLHFPSLNRTEWTLAGRLDELERWAAKTGIPNMERQLHFDGIVTRARHRLRPVRRTAKKLIRRLRRPLALLGRNKF